MSEVKGLDKIVLILDYTYYQHYLKQHIPWPQNKTCLLKGFTLCDSGLYASESISVHVRSSSAGNIGRLVQPVNSIPHRDIDIDIETDTHVTSDRLTYMPIEGTRYYADMHAHNCLQQSEISVPPHLNFVMRVSNQDSNAVQPELEHGVWKQFTGLVPAGILKVTFQTIIQGLTWLGRKVGIHEMNNKPAHVLVQNARGISFPGGNLTF